MKKKDSGFPLERFQEERMKKKEEGMSLMVKILIGILVYQALLMTAASIVWFVFAGRSQEFNALIAQGIQTEEKMSSMAVSSAEKIHQMTTNYTNFIERHPILFEIIDDLLTRIENEFRLGKFTNTNGQYFNSLCEVPNNILELSRPLRRIINELNINTTVIRDLYNSVSNVTKIASEIEQRFLNNGKIEISF